MCVGLQMKLKFHLTYILLTLSTILAEDIYSRQSKTSGRNGFPEMEDTFDDNDSDEDASDPDFESPELTTVSDHLENDKNDRIDEIIEQNEGKSEKIKEPEKKTTEEQTPEDQTPDEEDKDEDDSEIDDNIEKSFNFDDMGSDVSGYDSYYGDSKDKSKKDKWHWNKKKKGPPRYPPIDKDKLYEVALLAYTRDFHLGMLI